MRVLIAYNEPVLPVNHPEADSERAIVDVVDSIVEELECGDLELSRLGIGRDLKAFRETLRASPPDVVFNLFEGFGDDPTSECRFAIHRITIALCHNLPMAINTFAESRAPLYCRCYIISSAVIGGRDTSPRFATSNLYGHRLGVSE